MSPKVAGDKEKEGFLGETLKKGTKIIRCKTVGNFHCEAAEAMSRCKTAKAEISCETTE